MRAVLLSLILIVTDAVADLPLQRRELEPQEKTRLLSHARETCVGDPVEVSGFSYEGPDGNTWEADARVYFAPYRSDSNLCKSHICMFSSMHPMKRRGERVPGDFTWGDPVSIDGYSVWPSQDGKCLGSPSSKIALSTPIEEHTLVALLDRSRTLIEEGRAWLRKNHPDASLMLDQEPGQLESISVKDNFGVSQYWMIYGGLKGLLVRVSTKDGEFVVDQAGRPSPAVSV